MPREGREGASERVKFECGHVTREGQGVASRCHDCRETRGLVGEGGRCGAEPVKVSGIGGGDVEGLHERFEPAGGLGPVVGLGFQGQRLC